MNFRLIAAVIVSLSLSACASLPPKPVPVDAGRFAADGSEFDGNATVYVMRDDNLSGAAYSVDVALDKTSQGSIRRETYVKFPAPSGHHDLYATWPMITGEPSVAVSVDLAAGKTYYFRFSPNFGVAPDGMIFSARLGPIRAADAVPLLAKYEVRH